MGQETGATIRETVAFDLACYVGTTVRYHIREPWWQGRWKGVSSSHELKENCGEEKSRIDWIGRLHRPWTEQFKDVGSLFQLGGERYDESRSTYLDVAGLAICHLAQAC
jgi:hypothetical protein